MTRQAAHLGHTEAALAARVSSALRLRVDHPMHVPLVHQALGTVRGAWPFLRGPHADARRLPRRLPRLPLETVHTEDGGLRVSPKPAPPTLHCPCPEAMAGSFCERLGGTQAQGAGRTLTGHPRPLHVTLDSLAREQATVGSAFGNRGAGGLLGAL